MVFFHSREGSVIRVPGLLRRRVMRLFRPQDLRAFLRWRN